MLDSSSSETFYTRPVQGDTRDPAPAAMLAYIVPTTDGLVSTFTSPGWNLRSSAIEIQSCMLQPMHAHMHTHAWIRSDNS